MKRRLHRWRRAVRSRRAAAALEFALTGPILLLFLGGAADFGLAVYGRGRLAAGVTAGAEYAVLQGTNVNTSNVQTLVQNVSGLNLGANNPIVTKGAYCVENTPSTLVASSSTCPDGTQPGTYVVINASYTSPLFIPLGSITGGLNITESASVQLQ